MRPKSQTLISTGLQTRINLCACTQVELKKQFKARPIPRSVSRPPTAMQREPKKLTVAQSPQFKATQRPRAVQQPPPATVPEEPEPEPQAMGPRKLTESKPFKLMTEDRGQIHQGTLSRSLSEEKAAHEKACKFHARAMPDFSQIGFLPTESEKELTGKHLFTHRRCLQSHSSVCTHSPMHRVQRV